MYYSFGQTLLIFVVITLTLFKAIDGFETREQESFEYREPTTYRPIFSDVIDIGTFLKNRIVLNSFFKCWMGSKKCSPVAKQIKEALPEIIGSDCAFCSEHQKEVRDTICTHLIKYNPYMFEALARKYDPNQIYLTQFYDQDSLTVINL